MDKKYTLSPKVLTLIRPPEKKNITKVKETILTLADKYIRSSQPVQYLEGSLVLHG